jgi:hypothetical protein
MGKAAPFPGAEGGGVTSASGENMSIYLPSGAQVKNVCRYISTLHYIFVGNLYPYLRCLCIFRALIFTYKWPVRRPQFCPFASVRRATGAARDLPNVYLFLYIPDDGSSWLL